MMKKMLLVSMFKNVSNVMKTIEPDLKDKTVTYIPTASIVEKLGFFVKLEKRKLKKLGLIVDELEISTSSYEAIKNKLEKNDYIYVTGGNTFFLLQELRRTGADKILVNEVNKGKFYIGESAGAVVVAPNIEYSAKMDNIEKAPDLVDYTGLNLIDFYIVPHYQNREFKVAVEKIVNDYSEVLDLRVINDNQSILIEGGEARVLQIEKNRVG